MKYSILINQCGIVASGLHKSTDIVDWALLEYIADWQIHSNAKKLDDHVWIDYKHVIDEMPILGLNLKSSISNRIKKLVGIGLASVLRDEDSRIYVKTTALYSDAVNFRPVIFPKNGNERGVHGNERGVHGNERGVHGNEHRINNQLINNQESLYNPLNPLSSNRLEKIKNQSTINSDDMGASRAMPGGTDCDDGFGEFWTAYPKKKAKNQAQRAWKKLHPDKPLQQKIIAAVILATTQDVQWLKDGGQYIPHPASYLNGRRWEDEIQTVNCRRSSHRQAGLDENFFGGSGYETGSGHRKLSLCEQAALATRRVEERMRRERECDASVVG